MTSGEFTFETLLYDGEFYRVRADPESGPYNDCFIFGEDYHEINSGLAGCFDGICEVQC